ncbi:MAG: DUF2461 domain-containing protein [Acidimicrobiales bacterium]|jgi:uncharacterized protein (TIGR02453 family)
MGFRGWTAEAIEFYEGLEADNSKTYWNANKSVYEELVLQPMTELLAELAPEFGEAKLFRPYRDVRFSANKAPYKTAIGATLGWGGYVQLSAQGLASGSGMWMMAPDQLERYRTAVAAETTGESLVGVLKALRAAGLQAEGHDSLKTAPKGYAKDHPRIELLRYKGVTSWKQWPPGAWLGKATAKDRVVTFLRKSLPLNEWLAANVGSSQLAHSGRH